MSYDAIPFLLSLVSPNAQEVLLLNKHFKIDTFVHEANNSSLR